MWFLIQKSNPVWFFDATGSILQNIKGQSAAFLYSIVCYDSAKHSILPIAEFLTTNQSVCSISEYLTRIRRYYLAYYGLITPKRDLFAFAPIIVTDFSWALINSVLEVFNRGMTIIEYIFISFDFIIKKNPIQNIQTYIYLCSTHFLKNFIKGLNQIKLKIDKKFQSKAKKILIYSFTLLQNAIDIKQFEFYLEHIYNIFNQQYRNEKNINSLKIVAYCIKNRKLDFDIVGTETLEESKRTETQKKLNNIAPRVFTVKKIRSLKKQSPFRKYFDKMILFFQKSVEKNKNDFDINEFFEPALFHLILQQLYLLPLWTGIFIQNWSNNRKDSTLQFTRLNNNPAEVRFHIIKNKTLNGNKVMPSEFVSLTFNGIHSKFIEHYKDRVDELGVQLTQSEKELVPKSKKIKKGLINKEPKEIWKPKKGEKFKRIHGIYYEALDNIGVLKTNFENIANSNIDFNKAFSGIFT